MEVTIPLDRLLELYDAGSIATREVSNRILQQVTCDNRVAVIDVLKTRPELYQSVQKMVDDFAGMSDDDWEKVVTVEPGAYARVPTEEEKRAKEERLKQEHRNLRRGVEAMQDFNPDWVSPPGDTINLVLQERKISLAQFAQQMGKDEHWCQRLIDGFEPITDAVALKLSQVVGSTQKFWIRREARYRQDLPRDQCYAERSQDTV